MNAAIAASVLGAAFVLASRWDHRGYAIGAALLALLCALFLYRAWEFSTSRWLNDSQRARLRLRLQRVPPPVKVRIVAVPDDKAIHLARELRDIFLEAGWPARGIFKTPREHAGSNSPSVEAEYLLLTLREFGLEDVTSTKAMLPEPGTLELLVGRRPTY